METISADLTNSADFGKTVGENFLFLLRFSLLPTLPALLEDFKQALLRKYNGPGGDVTIPEGVKEIGDEAFRFCESLTSVIVPKSVTKIGRDVFSTVRV